MTALHLAANKGHTETLEVLLSSVTSDEIYQLLLMTDADKNSVISGPSYSGHIKTVQHILNSVEIEKIFDILRTPNQNEWTAAHIAAYEGHTETLTILLSSVTSDERCINYCC